MHPNPRHSCTKHIKKQGTINALSQALGLHNMGACLALQKEEGENQ